MHHKHLTRLWKNDKISLIFIEKGRNYYDYEKFKNPRAKSRLSALSFSVVMMTTALAGCSDNSNQSIVGADVYYELSTGEKYKKVFEIGEHIVSVPTTSDPRYNNMQYKYFQGYIPVGIATSAHGMRGNVYAGGCILYVNTQPVKAKATDFDDDGTGIYTDFGTPITLENAGISKKKYK